MALLRHRTGMWLGELKLYYNLEGMERWQQWLQCCFLFEKIHLPKDNFIKLPKVLWGLGTSSFESEGQKIQESEVASVDQDLTSWSPCNCRSWFRRLFRLPFGLDCTSLMPPMLSGQHPQWLPGQKEAL